ncbi:MAG: 50S ribosomal protein L15 [Bacteroidales bacterium]|jgi:large subunit ribosomal protein L15|nr:50S ribosomal protein L15 [Bacteroidales bacterium]
MELSNLTPAKGSIKKNYRVGRGYGSGNGKTAGRGHKGAQSRSGYSRKAGFEGGQMPLYRRVPKGGFKNINRVEYSAINLDSLQALAELKNISDINVEILIANGLVSKHALVKVLGRGEIKTAVNVSANAFSETAKKAIEAAGGTVTVI